MATNQLIHQESGTVNPQQITSNPRPPPPKKKTSPVVSDIMGRLNHHAIDNGDVDVHPSEFPFEYNSESIPDTDTTPIKSIDDDEMDHLLELFH